MKSFKLTAPVLLMLAQAQESNQPSTRIPLINAWSNDISWNYWCRELYGWDCAANRPIEYTHDRSITSYWLSTDP